MNDDTIIFNLKKEWFDKIKSGEKKVEYRRICDHWIRRICEPEPRGMFFANGRPIRRFKYAEFRLGYKKKETIKRRITNIDIGPCPYEGWNDKNYFRIFFN